MTDTIRRVSRPRGVLTAQQTRRLHRAAEKRDAADTAYRAEVVAVLAEGASFAEVRKTTGLSTSTLQAWKRDAQAQ